MSQKGLFFYSFWTIIDLLTKYNLETMSLKFFLGALLIFALGATVLVMISGLVGMVCSSASPKSQNKLMQMRVLFQTLSFILFSAAYFLT